MDVFFHKAQRLLASDLYTFVVAGGLCYALLLHESRRQAALARRMEIAAEVNHHIRNALTSVVFTAAVQNDPALEAVLREATERIYWVLNTVLPDGSPDLQWPVQAPSWTPSTWQRSFDLPGKRPHATLGCTSTPAGSEVEDLHVPTETVAIDPIEEPSKF